MGGGNPGGGCINGKQTIYIKVLWGTQIQKELRILSM